MSTINERIQTLVAHTGLTKTGFGKEINLTQSMVSKLCSGSATPSERTIADICRVFNVNETWLLTGIGEMIDYTARESEFRSIFSQVNSDPETTERFVKALARVPEAVLPALLEDFIKTVDEYNAAEKAKAPDATNIQD